jgi:ubiquinone/menaquinone biosynthesis C-methylase UbiE
MSSPEKTRFFVDLAAVWDGLQNLEVLASQLQAGLVELGVGADETVLDVGCGTGNLTAALLNRLGPQGRVLALDLAPAMIEVASCKNQDPRIEWHIADAQRLPLSSSSVDRVMCFSVWPHFDDPFATALELGRVLRGGGRLHVWHLASRARINAIHASASEAVQDDLLRPAGETASLLCAAGLDPIEEVDDEHRYLVSAVKRTS